MDKVLINSIILVATISLFLMLIDIGVGLANIRMEGKIAVTFPSIYAFSLRATALAPQIWLWLTNYKNLKNFKKISFLWILALTNITVNNLIWDPVWIYAVDMKCHYPEPLWGTLVWTGFPFGVRPESACTVSQFNFAFFNALQGFATLTILGLFVWKYDKISFKIKSKSLQIFLALFGWLAINYLG